MEDVHREPGLLDAAVEAVVVEGRLQLPGIALEGVADGRREQRNRQLRLARACRSLLRSVTFGHSLVLSCA